MNSSLSRTEKSADEEGHILRKVYNCREPKNFWPPTISQFPEIFFHFITISDDLFLVIYQKFLDIPSIFPFHPPKISDALFLVIFSISYVSPLPFQTLQALPNAAGTTAQPIFVHHSFSKSHAFHLSFLRFSTVAVPNLQLQLYNSHFKTANYNFYNCRNCHQLHVKICPATKLLRYCEKHRIPKWCKFELTLLT